MPTYRGHHLPSIPEVVRALRTERDNLRSAPEHGAAEVENPALDVRLVVGRKDSSFSGCWQVNAGPVDYDTWHGHCGASSLDGSESLATLRSIARDLLEEVRESIDTEAGS